MPSLRYRFLLIVFCLFPLLAPAAETPGMSAAKPAEGRFVETERGYMVPYTQTIPGTKVAFKMIPVPGGEVKLGLREAGEDDEDASVSSGVTVRLDPYWIGEREVTWAEYWPFMALNTTFTELSYLRGRLHSGDEKLTTELEQNAALRDALTAEASHVDGVTAPTGLYDPSIAYYSGEEADLPAVTMTPYAARQYTKWLSVLLGVDYRLPSEAEWEHAARAGAAGDQPDPESLDGLSWYDDNSDYEAHPTGEKKPNAWGLHDTLGNVAELVLDAPSDNLPESPQPLSWRAAIAPPKAQFPRIAKGGFYESAAEELRFAQRMLTEDEEWKASDPNSPLSPWWFADDPSCGVGMRIVRPLDPLDQPTRELAWEIDSPDLREAVEARIKEGRGKLQTINRNLPKVVEQLDSPGLRKLID